MEEGKGLLLLQQAKVDLDETVQDLDVKLNRVLAKQEYDYLQSYNVYVKRKDKELRELVAKISEKHSNAS